MYEFKCPSPVPVSVRLGGGSLDIVAEDRDTATVEVSPYDNSDAARDAVANTRVEMRGGLLVVEAPESSGWVFRRSARLRVDVRIPLDCPLQIRIASADASCHGRYATASVNTASGDAFVERVTGDVTAYTASGDMRLGEVGGALKVTAASGDVSVQSVGGSTVARSASGDIEIEYAGSDVRATAASGDVKVGAARSGAVSLNTASGDVSVGVAAGTGVWLDLITISGSTRTDLNVGDGEGPAARKDLTVQVRTASGDITVMRVVEPG